MKDCSDQVGQLMNPESAFVISDENKQRIKELLVNLQKEKLLEEDGSSKSEEVLGANESALGAKVLETFTNMLFEAL